ncbi:MAG: branched-chain amino acid ABC transporter permease [Deltaproteobacteria bacterium]|nr:branched-chain amino acid ABC transporter permease [Deltaproteobacteria bacterium]
MSTLLIYALHGLVYGMLLFLVASGLTLVFGMMDVLNIAHAAFYMLGAYFGYTVVLATGNFWLALIAAPIAVGLLGALVERYFLKKVHIHGHAFELLITFGVFFVIGEVVKWVWGNFPRPMDVPSALAGSIKFIGLTYPFYRFFILFFALLVLAVLAYVFFKTRLGMTIRAAVSDTQMLSALGINVPRLFLYVFSGGAALAGLAGVVAAPFLSTYPGMGLDMMVDIFVVVVIGGFGSIMGAFLASLMIGELQSFGILFIPQLALVFQFLLMALVLISRPTGLFGEKV